MCLFDSPHQVLVIDIGVHLIGVLQEINALWGRVVMSGERPEGCVGFIMCAPSELGVDSVKYACIAGSIGYLNGMIDDADL